MTITIYDYVNRPTEVQLPDKEIECISITVLSGDETGFVLFNDGSTLPFDASDCRLMNYFDDNYVVTKDNLEAWNNFTPTKGGTAAYERADLIWGVDDV